jgi:hypothetical protein
MPKPPKKRRRRKRSWILDRLRKMEIGNRTLRAWHNRPRFRVPIDSNFLR